MAILEVIARPEGARASLLTCGLCVAWMVGAERAPEPSDNESPVLVAEIETAIEAEDVCVLHNWQRKFLDLFAGVGVEEKFNYYH